MKIASYKHAILLVLLLVISITAYIVFITSPFFPQLTAWSQQNFLLYLTTLLVIKIVSIIYPPLPGGIFTLGSIPIIGWLPAYAVDITGSFIGSSTAYYLGNRYGFHLLAKLFDIATIEKLKKVKIKKHREIEGVFVLRILSGGLILEAICYGAGLIHIRYRNFIIGFMLSHILIGLPAFMLFDSVIAAINLPNILFNLLWGIILFGILYRLRGRYFE